MLGESTLTESTEGLYIAGEGSTADADADAKRLRKLKKQSARLKRIVVDEAVESSVLRKVARGNF